jgi:hypothetical protein
MNQFKLIGSFSPVDRQENGGEGMSVETRLIVIHPIQYFSVGDSDELNAGKLPIGTFRAGNQTHEGSAFITMCQCAESKQQQKTFHSPSQLEDSGCIVFNTLLKLDGHQVNNITLYGFPVPIWHKNCLMKIPMHLCIDQ